MRKKSHLDLITIGEAGMDTFLLLEDASLLCTVDHDKCWLCLSYADKIPVAQHHESLGHNACNVAVGAARLGLRAALYAAIGDDHIGKKIIASLAQEGVATNYLQVKKNSSSSSSVVLNYQTERTILIYHQPFILHVPKLPRASWVYLTSLGKDFRHVHKEVLEQVGRNGWKIAFNPGDKQLKAGKKVLAPVLRNCALLVVNKEEAQRLCGVTEDAPKTLLNDLLKLGPEMVVMTDGSDGAFAYDGKKYHYLKATPSKVKERTGAGDSFSTGVIAGLHHGRPLSEALLWGAGNAASVIEHIGPQKGLLTQRALLQRIRQSGASASEL